MKLNSINTYNQSMKAKSNPNFGMAKWVGPNTMKYVSQIVENDDAIKIFSDVKKAGCKNSLISVSNGGVEPWATTRRELDLAFPRQNGYICCVDLRSPAIKDLQKIIPEKEKMNNTLQSK